MVAEWFASNLAGEDALQNWASIVTIASLVITPIFYFVQRWHGDNSERKRASKNLYVELDDALDGLDAKKHDDLKHVTLADAGDVYFTNRSLNHDFYDSLVSSGKINFLKPELQQPLQDAFQRIKDHNFYIRKIRDIEDSADVGEDVGPKIMRYYETLGRIEIMLMDDIPKIKERLKEEFKLDLSVSRRP